MCGRYVSVRSDDDILEEFDAVIPDEHSVIEPNYNVAPTDPVRIVVNRHDLRQIRTAAWGLVPSWSKDRKGAARMINARVESVPTKPAFRAAYAKRRCLVPADGWYEWQVRDSPSGPVKQPMYMTPPDGHPLAFAGLYEFWRDPAGTSPTLTTCTIITSPSVGELEGVHERMPLLVPRSGWARWLDPSVSDPADLLAPWDEAAGEHLELRPVSTKVNKVDNDGPDLVARVDPLPESATLF